MQLTVAAIIATFELFLQQNEYLILQRNDKIKVMNAISSRVTAEIGGTRIWWPFATLRVTKQHLHLGSDFSPNIDLRPEEVVRIRVSENFTLFGKWIIIEHNNPVQKHPVAFRTFQDAPLLLARIQEVGFIPEGKYNIGESTATLAMDKNNGTRQPYNGWYTLILGGSQLLLFTFILLDISSGSGVPILYGFATLYVGMLLFEVAILVSPKWRQLFLRDGIIFTPAVRRSLIFKIIAFGVFLVVTLLILFT